MAIFTYAELAELGIRKVGQSVRIDKSVHIFGGDKLTIGDNVRIDCFCMLSAGEAGITIGSHVHIGVGCQLFGTRANITLEDFSGLSSRVSLFASSDDFTGGYLTNPTIPDRYKNVKSSPVRLAKHAVVGCGSVVMPGVVLGVGAAVGALSVVRKSVGDFQIAHGNPCRLLPLKRNRERLELLEKQFLTHWTAAEDDLHEDLL